jgi:DNA polymerase III sliding clamp (beta) subunit (PCNA family)
MASGEIAPRRERERNLTKVVFETAAIADAIKKAARVAPTKGSAFDKASGILIQVEFSEDEAVRPTIVVRATDLNVFYSQWVDCEEATGRSTTWRLPSALLAGVMSSLNIGKQRTTTFEEKDAERGRILHLSAGRTKSKIVLSDPEYFPDWEVFDPSGLHGVENLASRLNLVDWACDKNPPLNGIYIDGKCAVGTDKYKIIRADLPIDEDKITKPVVVPSKTLAGVLDSNLPEVNVAFEDDSLLIMPDDYTQIKAMLLAAEFPSFDRAMDRSHPEMVKFRKMQLVEIMNRAMNFVGSDRFPTLQVFIGKEEIAVMMANQEIGLLGDVVSIPGQAMHDRIQYKLSPANIISSIEKAPSDEVELYYYQNPLKSIRVVAPGYEAWIAPRREAGE